MVGSTTLRFFTPPRGSERTIVCVSQTVLQPVSRVLHTEKHCVLAHVVPSCELTGFPVFRHRYSLHLRVDGHNGDGIFGVWFQVLQDSGGGGSRDLVLKKRNISEPAEAWWRVLAGETLACLSPAHFSWTATFFVRLRNRNSRNLG